MKQPTGLLCTNTLVLRVLETSIQAVSIIDK